MTDRLLSRSRRRFGTALAGFALAAGLASPAAAAYPESPVTIVVGWKAGGGTDLVARYIADHVSREAGAEVVVENRPGAGSMIAAEQIANAEADGTTLMFATADSHTLAPLLRSDVPYDPMADFTPIYLAATLSFSLMSRPDLGAESVEDVVELSKDGGLTLGTWGVGSTAHIAMEMFAQATGADLVHVPYQGSAPAINDLQNGQIDLMFLGPGTATQNVEDGTMSFVAAASPERIGLAPDIETFAEQGVDGVEMQTWFGLFGPAGLPEEAVSFWTERMDALMEVEEFTDLLEQRGMDAVGTDAAGLTAYMNEQSARLGEVIDAAGIALE